MSRVSTSIEQYRAATDRPDSDISAAEVLKHLKAVGQARPKTHEEAEIKLQFLLDEDLSETADAETLSEIVMQAYLERLMLEF